MTPNKKQRAIRRDRCNLIAEGKLELLRSVGLNNTDIVEMRNAVLRGDCPLCSEGGFKSIAGHTQQMHGILSRDLRDLLGITYTESICSKELHEKFSNMAKAFGKNPRAKKSPSGHKKYSLAGEKIRNSNLAPPLTWVSINVLRENGRRNGKLRKGTVPWNKNMEHGTGGMYKRGCKCDMCYGAIKEQWKKANKNRKEKNSNGNII